MKLCFDLDETLCSCYSSAIPRNYAQCLPLPGAKAFLSKLKTQGHIVIIQTARGMGRYRNNALAADAEFRHLTELQLAEWGFEYDLLLFGKASADLYIDDKGFGTVDYEQVMAFVSEWTQQSQIQQDFDLRNEALHTKLDHLQSLLKGS